MDLKKNTQILLDFAKLFWLSVALGLTFAGLIVWIINILTGTSHLIVQTTLEYFGTVSTFIPSPLAVGLAMLGFAFKEFNEIKIEIQKKNKKSDNLNLRLPEFKITQTFKGQTYPLSHNIFWIFNPNSFSIKVRLFAKIFLDENLKNDFSSADDHYGGTKLWRLNPNELKHGTLPLSSEVEKSTKKLRVEILIDSINGEKQNLLPREYIYDRNDNEWWVNP